MPNPTVQAAAIGLPTICRPRPDIAGFAQTHADPIPGLASRSTRPFSAAEAADQARALNDVVIALNALLAAEGGVHA